MNNIIDEFKEALEQWFNTAPGNFVTADMALDPSDVGKKLYETPIIAIGDADDPLWETLHQKEAVGKVFRSPKEWMPESKTVVSYFAPFTDFVIDGNCVEPVDVGNGWLYARVEGQAFLTETNHFIEGWFASKGIKAYSPYAGPEFKYVFEPGTSEDIADKTVSFTSNWSERHVAFVCGLGTFGLQKALITEKGVCGRFGSVITDASLPVTERTYTGIYEWCKMCGACCRCPGGAIDLATGKSHHLCSTYFDTIREKYAPRYGCGKCYVNVPCMKQRP